jgi:serine/threonine protein kinase
MRKGPTPGARFPIRDGLVLGRHSKADIVVQDAGASRRHAAVIPRADGFHILDLGSTNGTVLNGKPVRGEVPLREGDLIEIGAEAFEFVLGDEAPKGPVTASIETAPLSRSEKDDRLKEYGNARLPREMGKFVLLDHLGRGGMGEVFRARDRDGGPDLAIKFIRSDIANREAFLDFFHNREAVLAREIDHPNIITIFEHGIIGDQHFIAMEYVDGESLQERIRRGPVPFDDALEILRQVACGLSAAHKRNVVHSDIKPANIMILKECGGESREEGARSGDDAGGATGIPLEFPEGVPEDGGRPRYDDALQAEIRKRLGEPSPDLLLDPPYLPRPSEMRFLRHYWENLRESGGYLLLVEGEPGTGKDRLLSEFVKDLGLSLSIPGAFVPPPAKLFEIDASRIEGIPQLHANLFPDRGPLEKPTREAIEEILRALSSDPEPLVVRILDLDRATPVSCELLHGLARILPRRPILVLASLDSGGLSRNTPLREFLRTEGSRIKELYLRPLTEYQIGRYLQDLFREPLRQDRLAADLHRLTGGNFARLLETLRSFFQRGILKPDRVSGRVVYQPSQREFELEEGKQLWEKFRRYGKVEQKAIEGAAFIGPEFLFDTLLRLTEIDETALFFIVRDLLYQGFITERSRTLSRFTNEAFQRYLAERAGEQRARLHRKVAWLLDDAPLAGTAGILRLRAHHWGRAGDQAQAIRLLLEGARQARNEYDIDLARQMYQEILAIYRSLAEDETARRTVNEELKAWFQREANWYEVLGGLGEQKVPVQVKITDFGISFKVRDVEDPLWMEKHVPLGTPRYLAPERVRRETGGPKSDIFALGIIAYEMLAGEPPFPGKKGHEAMRCNLVLPIPEPKAPEGSVGAEFLDLFRGMTEKDEDLRWDAERILHTIERMQFEMRMR